MSSSFGSEALMCDHFMEVARQNGWDVYPETEDFDILLVANERCHLHPPGTQVGVHAKLRANIDVLYQSLPRTRTRKGVQEPAPGPRYYAILVPQCTIPFRDIAARLQIKVLCALTHKWVMGGESFAPSTTCDLLDHPRTWFPVGESKCWVPGVQVKMSAGTSGPKKLTKWKLGAIRICLKALHHGYVTSKDFKEHKVSMTRWFHSKWIRVSGKVTIDGRSYKRYELIIENNPPHLQYPEVTEALHAEFVPSKGK